MSLAAAASLPLWLPGLESLAGAGSAAIDLPGLGFAIAALAGAALGAGLRSVRIPRGRSLLWTGGACVLLAAGALPRTGAAVLGLLGGAVLVLLARSGEEVVDEAPVLAGAVPGLAAVALLCGLDACAPWLGPDVWLAQVAVAAGLLGAGTAGLFGVGTAGARRRGLRSVLLPLGLAAALSAAPRLPHAMGVLSAGAGGAAGVLLPLLAVGFVSFAVLALAGPGGRATPGAAAGGLVWWLVGPGLLGAGGAAAVAVGAVCVAVAAAALARPGVLARLVGLVGPAAAVGLLLLPPLPDGVSVAQPWRLGSEPVRIAQAERELGRTKLERAEGARGRWLSADASQPRVLAGHRSARLNAESRGADAFFGHLAGLLGEAPRRSLILAGGHGAAIDAVRRGTGGTVDLLLRPSASAAALSRHGAWNRNVLADPSVRIHDVDPLLGGSKQWDAILIDLPPPWAPGASSAWSRARLRRVASRLTGVGHAVFRLPLDELSSDDLGAWLADAVQVFPGLFAWLDPTGASNLLVVARNDDAPLDAAAVFRAFSRRAVAEDLAKAALRDPVDVLERGLADRRALAAAQGSSMPPSARSARAGARARRGRRGLALASLGAASVDPSQLFDLRDVPTDRVQETRDRLEQAGRTRSDYLKLLGAWQAGQGDQVLALAAAMAKASADPTKDLRTVVGPWIRRGDAFRAQGLLDQAQAEYVVARSFSPADPELNLKLADVLRLLGRLDDAEAGYQAVLERHPRHLEATFGLSALRTAQGSLAEAAALLEEAQAIHPGSAPLLINLGWLHIQLADREPRELATHLTRARVVYQRATALEPRWPEGWAGMALVYERQEDYERALGAVERALTLDGTCVYRGQLGGYLAQLGRLDRARAELQRAILDCPDNPDALNALGAVEARQGRWIQARDAWTRTIRVQPGHPAATQNLADLEASGALELDLTP